MAEVRKVMVFYPPGSAFQRGEDRCQANIEASTSSSPRADNDLGYASSTLKARGYDVFLKDYQNEKLSMAALLDDFVQYSPDVMFISTTNATIFSDLEVVAKTRSLKPDTVSILKGAVFFDVAPEILAELDLSNVDYLIGGESEFILADLVDAHFECPRRIPDIGGIYYKRDHALVSTGFERWESDLDSLPFPDRDAMNNALYVRPDTGEPMATLSTSRGCPFSCIYCLTPVISGKRVRLRNPQNVVEEIDECYMKHGIGNFFFKSDTFTIDKRWVAELCDLIERSPFSGKIEWVANSRVNPLERETLERMRRAGCWLVAFGFESGSQETLERIKKGATVEEAKRAARYCREVGLKVFGFYMIGFPWEDLSHLKATRDLMFEIDADFVELHLAIPFYGTELHRIAEAEGLLKGSVLGEDYFNPSTVGTKSVLAAEIARFRNRTLLSYHARPTYILRKAFDAAVNPKILANYVQYGARLIRNILGSRSGLSGSGQVER
jgi:radical SAM superfamily enzyme YgiQ (UPF0313 family)